MRKDEIKSEPSLIDLAFLDHHTSELQCCAAPSICVATYYLRRDKKGVVRRRLKAECVCGKDTTYIYERPSEARENSNSVSAKEGLAPIQRTVFELVKLGHSFRDINKIMKFGTSKKHYENAIKKLVQAELYADAREALLIAPIECSSFFFRRREEPHIEGMIKEGLIKLER